jgi:ABC-type oligopeptide transport system ATPase subunit
MLNNFISKYPEVEKTHFKLWLSSTPVLQSIINNSIKGRSEFFEQKIKNKIGKFVPTKSYNKAINILNENKFLIIVGEPGIGKTTLAQFITYSYLANNFELIVVNENIREAEDLFLPDKKQVFYFDDFLGSNYLEILRAQNSDSALMNFIERITNSKTKRLILTSRTTILNKGRQLSFIL